MVQNFDFSIVIVINSSWEVLEESIKSIINQSFNFDKVQIILVDNGLSKKSKEVCIKYQNKYPNNIIFLFNESKNLIVARNLGLKYIEGKYVNFIYSSDKLSNNVLKKVNKFFLQYKEIDFVSIPILFDGNFKHPLNNKFNNKKIDNFINLFINPNYIQTDLNSFFIRNNSINGMEFNPDLTSLADSFFINKLLFSKKKYGLIKDVYCYSDLKYYRSVNNIISNKEECLNHLNQFYKELINYAFDTDGFIPDYIQSLFVYELRKIVEVPDINSIFKTKEEIDKFWEVFTEILSYIEEIIIKKQIASSVIIRSFLIFVKNQEFHVEVEGKQVVLKSNDYIINNLHKYNIWFDIIELKDNFLNFSGSITSNCCSDFISFEATKSSKGISRTYESKPVEYRNSNRKPISFLSIPWRFSSNFDLKIPISKNEVCRISFNVIYDDGDIRTTMKGRIRFKYYTFLSKTSHYFVKDNRLVLLRGNSVYVKNYSIVNSLKYELESIFSMLKNRPNYFIQAIFFRIIHFILYPLLNKKKIWMFSDRLDLCGDNGEHFFRYAIQQKDDVKKYFTILKDTDDYNRLKKIYGNNVVAFGSFKHRILYLFTDKFLQSQISPITYNPFYNLSPTLYCGLATGDVYFLQHGVARYDMSSWITKFDKRLSLILTVSDFDYNEFISDNYAYDEEIVQTLGFPRYDNLTNENLKKQIVLMPTWRNYIRTEDDLLNSEYFLRFNSLINNEKLINHAKDKGYEIVLKPHPLMYNFINLFNSNEYVKIDNITKHHDIICDSALMITDYSSVAFDFVYLKKPVIYYQYESGKDHHFDVGTVLDEEALEFGEIIKDEDVLIDKIIDYMDNNCIMEDIYKKRVDNFFKYTDKNNSKRVYEWIYKH